MFVQKKLPEGWQDLPKGLEPSLRLENNACQVGSMARSEFSAWPYCSGEHQQHISPFPMYGWLTSLSRPFPHDHQWIDSKAQDVCSLTVIHQQHFTSSFKPFFRATESVVCWWAAWARSVLLVSDMLSGWTCCAFPFEGMTELCPPVRRLKCA